jgi:hypothetical protein
MERTHRKEKLRRRSDNAHCITHSKFPMDFRYELRQEERAYGGQISSVRYKHGDRPSSDLGEPARYLKFNMK